MTSRSHQLIDYKHRSILSYFTLEPFFEKEVARSFSQHYSPVVIVKKADDTYRMAVDLGQLNYITRFHALLTCNMEEDLHKFFRAHNFSELDLSNAYYQIPLSFFSEFRKWTDSSGSPPLISPVLGVLM